MAAAAETSFWEWRERLRGRLLGASGGTIAEGGADWRPDPGPAPLDERLVQTIWAQQLLAPSGLRLADGRPLRVLDAGRWNGGNGPDFQGARLLIGEQAVLGDVEIHVNASDWLAHGHQRDLDYNGVVLHAVLRVDDGAREDALHNGRLAPRLELEQYVFPDLETLRRSLTPDDYQYEQPAETGRCQRMLASMGAADLADFLDRAGDERLLAKTQRLEQQAGEADLEQVFYQALMMALGSGPGRTLYYLLAKRTPPAEMAEFARELDPARRPAAYEALLMHVAGLAPAEEDLASAPEEARARAATLAELWARWERCWCDRVIPPTRRWYQGIRPVNFPTRRLGGVALLLARAGVRGKRPLADLLARLEAGRLALESTGPRRKRHPVLEDLLQWFMVPGVGAFWGNHYSFTAKPATRTMDLIGEGTALSLVLNALAPAALLAARRSGDEAMARAAQRLYALVPPLQPNHITEFMTRRLFGDETRARGIITTERRRQALFQIFHHCCRGEERNCDACYLLERR